MRFATPNFLLLIFALPLVGTLWYLMQRRKRQLAERFATPNLLPVLAVRKSSDRALWKGILLLAGAAAAIFAGARPQWGYEDRKIVSAGADVLIAVDVSRSMLAEDYKPNRLARAKELLTNILWGLKGDRVGVVAFAGDAAVVCPLTSDYSMARAALEGLDTSTVSTPGTNIGRAIDVALGAFDVAARGDKILVLLTDGEDHEGQAVAMAERAAKSGVKIFAIGIGTTQGMPIPDERGSYKTDREGKLVSTRLDFNTLTQIAERTAGAALKANPSGSSELQPILSELEKVRHAQNQETVVRVYHERFPWFVALALILLTLEMFVLETRTSREEIESC